MNIKLERHPPIETRPFNMVCELFDCKDNIKGYCHGCPGLVLKETEVEIELDVFKPNAHEWRMLLECSGFQKREEPKVERICPYSYCKHLWNAGKQDDYTEAYCREDEHPCLSTPDKCRINVEGGE